MEDDGIMKLQVIKENNKAHEVAQIIQQNNRKLMARKSGGGLNKLQDALQKKKQLSGGGHEESIHTDGEKEIPKARQLQREYENIPQANVVSGRVIESPMNRINMNLLQTLLHPYYLLSNIPTLFSNILCSLCLESLERRISLLVVLIL